MKKVKKIIGIICSIILLAILLVNKVQAATGEAGGWYKSEEDYLHHNNENLDRTWTWNNYTLYWCEKKGDTLNKSHLSMDGLMLAIGGGTFRSDFVKQSYNDILGAKLAQEAHFGMVHGNCLLQGKSNERNGVYSIVTLIDIDYNKDLGKIALNSNTVNAGGQTLENNAVIGKLMLAVHDCDTSAKPNLTVDGWRPPLQNNIYNFIKDSSIAKHATFSQSDQYWNCQPTSQDTNKIDELNSFIKVQKVALSDATIERSDRTINGVECKTVGRFKIKYAGKKIERIMINGKNANGKVYWTKSESGKDYSNSSVWSSNIKEIPSNSPFYLAFSKNLIASAGSSYEIKFIQEELEYYPTRIALCASSENSEQQFGVWTDITETIKGEEIYTIGHASGTTLKIIKKSGIKKEDGTIEGIQDEQVSGVKFVVYKRGTGFWSESKKDFVSNESQATKFETANRNSNS